MSSLKRAKWIEGITQSKRVLRDIAEIATTAMKDEDGKLTSENWKLVYPRPFTETPVQRGTLVVDAQNSRRYVPVTNKTEQITLTGTTPVALKNTGVVAETIVVKSADNTKTFAKTTDYTYDSTNNTLVRTASSTIATGASVNVTYGIKFFKLLSSVAMMVERKLTLDNPDRVIPTSDFIVSDYVAGKVKFNIMPPADALSFLLSYTERVGVFNYVEHEKVKLDLDPLDGLARTYMLSGSHGEIMQANDTRVVGQASAGGLSGVGEAAYTIDETKKQVTFATAPTLRTGKDKLLLTVWIYDDATFQNATRFSQLELTPVTSSGDLVGRVFTVSGSFTKFNSGKPHLIELFTTNTAPTLYKHLDPTNAGYEIVPAANYTVNYEDPEILFSVAPTDAVFATFTARGEEDYKVGVNKIKDRVVLKTTTTPENQFTPVIGEDYGAKDTATSLDMYIELTKPAKLINPETGLERYTNVIGSSVETQTNNHFIQARMFDKWDDQTQAFKAPTYDLSGVVVEKGASVSDWSKYSWFKDWKESLVDELDTDPGTSDVSKGIILHEVETNGMTEEFPIQFWISTNNNRLAIVLMGDPTLDQDNFLTSFAYIGRIHPYYESQWVTKLDNQNAVVMGPDGKPIVEEKRKFFENDVSGNFALTTGSSTIPAAIGVPPKGQALVRSVEVETNADGLVPGDLYDSTAYSYLVTYTTEGGESRPSKNDATTGRLTVNSKLVVSTATVATKGISIKVSFTLPEEATGYRIYRMHEANVTKFTPADVINIPMYRLVASVDRIGRERDLSFSDTGSTLPMTTSEGVLIPSNVKSTVYTRYQGANATARSFKSVVRDQYTGAILEVKFTDKWGIDTATGVNDISMFQTRSGLKYQRHQVAFTTTEQFMRKEKSGQSRYTGKFHLAPIYIEHSYDKQRGWLDGIMAVDDSGIEHLDELIVDKDLPTEEVYKFFRINAPFSMFNNSPNHAYGVAIIKSSQKWN